MPVSSVLLSPVALIVFGLVVGLFSGIMGLGGGAVMIPVMVLLYHMNQQLAHGTSLTVLAMPVTVGAVIAYYQKGNVNLRMAVWIAVGFFAGAILGAWFANWVRPTTLKLIFGFLLIYVAAYTVFGKENMTRTLVCSTVLVAVAMALYFGTQWVAQPSGQTPAATAVRPG